MSISEQVLEHYGVKGMAWGVRRTDAALARAAATRDGAKKLAKDVKDAKGVKGKASTLNKARIRVGTKTAQKTLNREIRLAKGQASKVDKLIGTLNKTPIELARGRGTAGAAQRRLNRGKDTQQKIAGGKKRVTNAVAKFNAIDISQLQFD